MSKTARSNREKKFPVRVDAALGQLVHGLGIEKTLTQFNAVTSWPEIVGEQIARVTEARRMDNGVLFVSVATAPWRAELTMRRLEIAEKINAALGKKVVREIRFR